MNYKSWKLTYDLLTTEGVEQIEVQFMYFETCMMTVKNLSKHCNIDNIKINSIKWGIKMQPYKKRFIKEYNELLERTGKLGIMLYKYEHNELDVNPNCSFELLEAQYHTMRTYLYILEQRAEIEKIKIK